MAVSKEELLEALDEVMRCHRSYAVKYGWNTEKIEEALRTAQEALEKMPETVWTNVEKK